MTEYVVVFLLFFAVLSFAWFYLQRAKARDASEAGPSTKEEPAAEGPGSPSDIRPEV